MENVYLNTIHIQGWKSIKDAEITFGKINILLGANGAGKSNLLSVFDLLRAIANNNVKLYIEKNGGANANYYYGTKTTPYIHIDIKFQNKNYGCKIISDGNDGAHVDSSFYGRPNSEKILAENGTITQSKYLDNGDIVKNNDTHTREIAAALSPFVAYHFHDTGATSPLKRVCDKDENRYLFPDGANIAAILYKIKNECPKEYEKIKFIISLILPGFKDFIILETDNYLKLRWQDKNSIDYTFPLSALSDGTLRFIALTTLLNQPEPPKLIIIDEPELGLHPEAIYTLSEMIKFASAKSQILISTQSVDLINCFEPENILIAENSRGETKISRPDENELSQWLNDYTLGEIWQKNIIGGNP